MEVKPGYKQTEVGVIPEEWGVEVLGKSCDIITKGTTPTSIGRTFTRNGISFLKAETISESGKAIPAKIAYVNATTHALMKRSQLNGNDVLISIAGVLGRVGLVEKFYLPANTNQALAIIRLSKKSHLERSFLFYALRSPCVSRQIRDINVQAAQANISLQNVRDFLLPVPQSPEQRAIATALSDVDALLGGLDRLIAKKRDLKQAAMQQLLTGQTRLPGFDGEWEMKQVLELGEVVTGGTPRTEVAEYWGDTYPWITPTDISTRRDMFSSERRLTEKGLDAVRRLPPNTVLVTCIASIGKNAILKTIGACNQQINALIPDKNSDSVFLYYLFGASKQYLVANSGVTATRIISKRAFSELTFRVPAFDEQTAIAAVLSDMDAELTALEARRNKTRDLKQAMMQELLTGKTRLVTPEVAHA